LRRVEPRMVNKNGGEYLSGQTFGFDRPPGLRPHKPKQFCYSGVAKRLP
jgi:hypothetical protein